MRLSGWRNKLRQTSFYFPFTLYFLLFIVAMVFSWKLLMGNNYDINSSFADIFYLLIKVAALFIILFMSLAFVSVLVPLVYFLYQKKKTGIVFTLETAEAEGELNQQHKVNLVLQPAIKPIFGFIKFRLQYGPTAWSSKFIIADEKSTTLFSTKVAGVFNWTLPQIKEYHITKGLVYFEDFFQFFSFAVNLSANNRFYTKPFALDKPVIKVAPRKTEDTTARIDEMRKVEGEYLNYKNFENNDDVRRIVWKVYARNKELVVRVPETMDPYASHIYLYASFFSTFNINGNSVAEVPFLNYYKTMVWTIYENLAKQGFEVRFVPDQPISNKATSDAQQTVKYAISTSHWQTDNDLVNYCKTRDAAVVVLSSFSDVEQVKQLVEMHGNDITFIFVPLTEGLLKNNMLQWVQWLFVENEKNDVEVYKTNWAASLLLRPAVVENEKRLVEIIGKYQRSTAM